MKSYYMKLLTAALSASMVLSVTACITSCNKEADKNDPDQSHSGMKISNDSPWYEASEFKVDLGLEEGRDIDNSFSKFAGCDDKYIYVETFCEYAHPGQYYFTGEDTAQNVSVVDRNTGETVKIIDMLELLGIEHYVNDVKFRNGVLEISSSYWDKAKKQTIYMEYRVDPMTNTVLDEKEVERGILENSIYDFGDYRIEVFAMMSDQGDTYYEIQITQPDGSVKTTELKEEGKSYYSDPSFMPIDKTQLLVLMTMEQPAAYYRLDLKTGKITREDSKDYEWLNIEYAGGLYNGRDGYAYDLTGTGISRYNMDKKCVEEVLNYSWSDLNRKHIEMASVCDVTDDSMLIFNKTTKNEPFGYHSGDFLEEITIISMKKVPNPHVGKQVLEMYVPYGDINDAVLKKVNEFNDTNGKYFIEISDRYTKEYDVSYIEDPDAQSTAVYDATERLGNKLAMDIMNGKGPDIFYDPYYLGPLNYKEHLTDLTPYIGELEKDKYFTNMTDLTRKDGKLYFLPLCVSAYGIMTDSKNAGASGTGFTTEEYEKFLKTTLNGKDLIDYSQIDYFIELFNAMKGSFIKDGKADFSGEDFAAIAKYVKDNVPEQRLDEPVLDDEGNPVPEDWYSKVPAMLSSAGDYEGYLSNVERTTGEAKLYGLPSSDGRGPAGYLYYNVAVSAHALDVGACCEFVKMLLADDVQYQLAKSGMVPINREAFRKAGLEAIDYFNTVSINAAYANTDTPPKNRVTFTKAHLDDIENTILSVTYVYESDPDIERVIYEEMPAYFTGQKSLDEVVKIAQDRVHKVLGERG